MNESKVKYIWPIIVAVILAVGLITSVVIGTNGIVKIKSSANTIMITGSAKQQITSDLIVWTGRFDERSPEITDAYAKLEVSRGKVEKYLESKGIRKEDIVFSAINTNIFYQLSDYGMYTNEVDYYDLSQTVTISSSDIDGITNLSRNATELINEGISFISDPPQYLYTKLADLKVNMLAEATKDAKRRAEMMAENAGSKLGKLKYADMGVMQITPLYSNDVSDYGISDTSSLEKEITAVVHCKFEIE